MPVQKTAIVLGLAATIAIYHAAANTPKIPSDLRDAVADGALEQLGYDKDSGNIPEPKAAAVENVPKGSAEPAKLPDDMLAYLGIPAPTEIPSINRSIKVLECDKEKRLFGDGLEALLSEDEIYNRLSARHPDVWLIGELHDYAIAYQAEEVRKIKAADPRVDCLFAEFMPGKESLIDETDPKEQIWKVAQAARRAGWRRICFCGYWSSSPATYGL